MSSLSLYDAISANKDKGRTRHHDWPAHDSAYWREAGADCFEQGRTNCCSSFEQGYEAWIAGWREAESESRIASAASAATRANMLNGIQDPGARANVMEAAHDEGKRIADESIDEILSELEDDDLVTASSVLETALSYVGGDRAKTHGDKGLNFRTTSILHRALDEAEALTGKSLSGAQKFALRMVLAKMSRILSGAYNPDDYVDICGYGACAGEIAAQEDSISE